MDAHGNFCMLMVIGAEDPGKVINKLETWKTKMKTNMDMNRNMVMISGPELDLLQDPGKYSCSVCRSRAGSNFIFCSSTHAGCTRNAVTSRARSSQTPTSNAQDRWQTSH